MIHELKTDPEVFTHVYNGLKDFEIRKNDRNFQESDTLILRETKHSGRSMKEPAGLSVGEKKPLVYTGREIECEVNYILHGPIYGLMDGWVIMGIEVMKHSSTPINR
jgi:hypothetical protein